MRNVEEMRDINYDWLIFRKFLTDDIQLEEVLQVRIRQCRIFAAALEDLSVVVGNGWEYQRAQNHRRVAALHHLPANSMIGRRDNLEPVSRKEGKRNRTTYRTLKYSYIDLAIPKRLVPLDPGDASAGMRACRLAGDGVVLLRFHDR